MVTLGQKISREVYCRYQCASVHRHKLPAGFRVKATSGPGGLHDEYYLEAWPRDAARLRCNRRKPHGHVEARMLGDIKALSKDVLPVPDDEIPATQVDYTIVGGKMLFQR